MYCTFQWLQQIINVWCHLPWVVMCTSISANASCSCSCFITGYVLVALGWYPKEGPRSASSFHHDLKTVQVDAPVASSVYHVWCTSGQLALS